MPAYRSVKEINAMMDERPDIKVAFGHVGGWRGLFDSPSLEFSYGTTREKWAVIESLKDWLGCTLADLAYLFGVYFAEAGLWHVVNEIHYAIARYAAGYQEAEDYLIACRHPSFPDRCHDHENFRLDALGRLPNNSSRRWVELKLLRVAG